MSDQPAKPPAVGPSPLIVYAYIEPVSLERFANWFRQRATKSNMTAPIAYASQPPLPAVANISGTISAAVIVGEMRPIFSANSSAKFKQWGRSVVAGAGSIGCASPQQRGDVNRSEPAAYRDTALHIKNGASLWLFVASFRVLANLGRRCGPVGGPLPAHTSVPIGRSRGPPTRRLA